MDARPTNPGLSRTERDAAAAIGVFVATMLVLLCTILVALHFLSGLPPIMVYGILFAVLVFAFVCGGALLKSEPTPRRPRPPELRFRPARRTRRAAARPRPLR